MHLSLVFLTLLSSVTSLKFLCYSPRLAPSHVNFLGKLADSLIDEGHAVVILSSLFDNGLESAGSKRARVIEIPVDDVGRGTFEHFNLWETKETWHALSNWASKNDQVVAHCNTTINHPGLIDKLREEKFDAAFGESMSWCMGGLFYLAGIESFAVTESIAYKDGMYGLSQMPTIPSYVPSIMGGSFGDEMNFSERAYNLFNTIMHVRYNYGSLDGFQKMFDSNFPGFPDVAKLMYQNSLYFLNSDPLVDFPRASAARVIEIGGISVSDGFGKLNQEWSSVLDLRPKTVFISFGTFALASTMPEAYKDTIRETAKAFPDVTFIWKYEIPEHNVSQGIPNLIETTYAPQNDLLRDPRLSAFVTHCGQGSTTEAFYAGVPLVAIPVIYDQIRNAFQIKRSGVGLNLDKSELGVPGVFEHVIREVLENPTYKQKAKKIASMLNDKPFTARETFVRNIEFLAKHGPLRQLDHYGRHLNFIQYFLIDVLSFAILLIIIVVCIPVYFIIRILRCVKNRGKKSTKID